MKQIIGYLRDFVREDFNWRFYAFTAVFLVAAFWVNYTLKFKKVYLGARIDEPITILYYALYYVVAYWIIFIVRAWMYRETALLRRASTWGILLFIVVAMALDNFSVNIPPLVLEWFNTPQELQYWLIKSLTNLDRFLAILSPLVFFRFITQYYSGRKDESFYGLTTKGFNWRPYVYMLLIMLPLVVAASFSESFLRAYPRYHGGEAEAYLGISRFFTYGVFETCYAIRFVSVEIYFRGFLALGLMRWFGNAALMPMVTLYAFWHFGKPMGEALGSIFGAFILGIIAMRSRSVLGGCFIHIGIAWMMDLTAYLQLYGLHF